MNIQQRGSFSRAQVAQLLQPIEPFRVVTGAHVKPHLAQQDVLAHLIRVFGFGNFDVEVREYAVIFEEQMINSNNKESWRVGYRALVRLTIRDGGGNFVAFYDGGSTGESEGQPSKADSHDLAFKSALSTATKRAAIHLGDQFGLSLYNRGQREALVRGSMINTDWASGDIQDGVTQQEEDGGSVADRQDAAAEEPQAAPSALPAPPKRATNGKQGTRKKKDADETATQPAQADQPAPAPEPTPEPKPAPSQPDAAAEDRAARAEMAAQQERQVIDRDRIIATGNDVDRDDEAAVAAWNAENGKLTGHYLTSSAELQRRAEAMNAPQPEVGSEPEPEPESEEDTPLFLDEMTGSVYDTQAELDAAIKARVQQKQAEREAAQASGPSAYEVATSEEPKNYVRRAEAATRETELLAVWNDATADGAMTSELRVLVSTRKPLVVQDVSNVAGGAGA